MTLTDQVILALTAKWQAAPALADVQVVDGPQADSDASPDWLFVGHDGGVDENDAAVAQQNLMAFARTKGEDAEVRCAAISVRGDTDIPAARQRAYAIVSAAEDALRADMQLGSLVMHAYVSGHTYVPVQTTAGAKVRVLFTVTYKAQL